MVLDSPSEQRIVQPQMSISSAELERPCSTTTAEGRPVCSCAGKVDFLVKLLSYHRQSSHCPSQKCLGWLGQRPWESKENRCRLGPQLAMGKLAIDGPRLMKTKLRGASGIQAGPWPTAHEPGWSTACKTKAPRGWNGEAKALILLLALAPISCV